MPSVNLAGNTTSAAAAKEDEFYQRLEVALDTVMLRSPAYLFWSAILLVVLGVVVALVMAERKIVRKIAVRNSAAYIGVGAGRRFFQAG